MKRAKEAKTKKKSYQINTLAYELITILIQNMTEKMAEFVLLELWKVLCTRFHNNIFSSIFWAALIYPSRTGSWCFLIKSIGLKHKVDITGANVFKFHFFFQNVLSFSKWERFCEYCFSFFRKTQLLEIWLRSSLWYLLCDLKWLQNQ